MANFWNQVQLVPPPINTGKVALSNQDVRNLYTTTSKACEILENDKILNLEAAMLSRVIYRMKHKFRKDKGFQSMEKVNRAILQYLNMNVIGAVQSFMNTIDKSDFESNEVYKYLPTLQMLHFVLIRLQGLAKLMCRITDSATITANYMLIRINTGQSWSIALLILGLVSRISAISNHLLQKTCQWYEKLYPYCKKLQSNGLVWLPSNYEFPEDLYKWVDVEPLGKKNSNSTAVINLLNKENDEIKKLDGPLANNTSDSNDVTIKPKQQQYLSHKPDLGEVLSRHEYKSQIERNMTPVLAKTSKKRKILQDENTDIVGKKPVVAKNGKKRKLKQDENNEMVGKKRCEEKHKALVVKPVAVVKRDQPHCIDNITDLSSLTSFLKKEDHLRQKKKSKALTKHLDLLQWRILQKLMVKFMKKLQLQDNLKNFKKIIYQAKKTLANNIKTI